MHGCKEREVVVKFVWIISIIDLCACNPGVSYSGKHYISEGQPLNISCIRSAYGPAKWYKNGQIIDPSQSNYSTTEEALSLTMVLMELEVEEAEWNHRGKYKCDSLSEKSHSIEIIPSAETDQKLQVLEPGHQRKVHLVPGKSLQIHCDKEEHEAFPINWYKDGRRLLDEENSIRIDGRTLTILRAELNDTGEYVCVVEELGQSYLYAGHQGSSTWVTSSAQVTDFPSQIRPILDRNFSLECEVQGFPTPRITWFIDGVIYNETEDDTIRYQVVENGEGLTNAVFFIPDITYDDKHVLMCVADNVDGIDRTVTELAVRENAIYTNEDFPGSGKILTPHTELVLNCNYSDDPNAIFTWLKDEQPLESGPESRIHLEPPTNNILKIERAVESDCGNYTCMTRSIRATIAVRSVVVLAKMESSRNVVQGQNIVLTCNTTQGSPSPVLKWYKDEQEVNGSDPRITIKMYQENTEASSELHIADANFEDRAEYTCKATNEISSANATILVRVKDKYAALWPFLGICAEVAVLCTIIFIYEKRRQKPDFDETETDHNTENKAVQDQEGKSGEVRQRK